MKYSSIRRERIENNEIYISIKYIKQIISHFRKSNNYDIQPDDRFSHHRHHPSAIITTIVFHVAS